MESYILKNSSFPYRDFVVNVFEIIDVDRKLRVHALLGPNLSSFH
jgi:hypothetical protein